MRILLGLIAILAVLASIVWYAGDPGWEPVVAGLGALLFLLGLFVAKSDKQDQKGASQTDQLRAEFEAIWPAYFETLEDDLHECEASVELARIRAKDSNPHPGIEIHSPSVATQFTFYHKRTISNYDKELGELLSHFLLASDKLRLSANTYNQLLYTDLLEDRDFGKMGGLRFRIDFFFAKEDMYKKSRRLEDAIDNLWLKLRYYGDLKPS